MKNTLFRSFKNNLHALSKCTLVCLLFCVSTASAQELGGKIKEAKASIKTYDNGDVVIEAARLGFEDGAILMCNFLFYQNTWKDHILESTSEAINDDRLSNFLKLKRCGNFEITKFSFTSISKSIDAGIPAFQHIVMADSLWDKLLENHKIKRPETSKKSEIDDYLKSSKIDYKKLKKGGGGHRKCLIIGYNKNTNELLYSMPWLNDYIWLSSNTIEKAGDIISGGRFKLLKLNANYDKVYKELEPKAEANE